jgi:hypothetical protein
LIHPPTNFFWDLFKASQLDSVFWLVFNKVRAYQIKRLCVFNKVWAAHVLMAEVARKPPSAGLGSIIWNYMRYGLWQRHRMEQQLASKFGEIYSIRMGQLIERPLRYHTSE